MPDKRVLVTAVSGDIGNNIVRILLEAKYQVYAFDMFSVVPCMNDVALFTQCPAAKDDNYIDFLIDFIKKHKIQVFIPTNEREIEKVNNNLDAFSALSVKILMQSESVLDICLDKYKTMQFLNENGISVPVVIEDKKDISEKKKYIIKGRKSNGSKDVHIVSGKDLLLMDNAFNNADSLVQEYIDGDEYTVGVFRDKTDIRTIIFKRTLYNGYSKIVKPVNNEKIEKMAVAVAEALNLSGYINIQLRMDSFGNAFIFEINPRISGTVYFRHMYGFEDVLWSLSLIDGEKCAGYASKNREMIGIRVMHEKFVTKEEK